MTPGRSFTWVATGPGVTTTARHDQDAFDLPVMELRLIRNSGVAFGIGYYR